MTMRTTIGVLGAPWRAGVDEFGALELASSTVRWFVGSGERWLDPRTEASVRQRRLDGTPVVETRLRVPGGDAVHRVFAVADGGGSAVIEIANESSTPFAVAFTGAPVRAKAGPSNVPGPAPGLADVAGDDAASAQLYPVAHRTTLVVTVPATATAATAATTAADAAAALPAPPAADQVRRGWLAQAETGLRLVVADAELTQRWVAARCDLLLDGPPRTFPRRLGVADALAAIERASEWCRAGRPAGDLVVGVAGAAVQAARAVRRRGGGDDAALMERTRRAIGAAAAVALHSGEPVAARDLEALAARLGPPAAPSLDPAVLAALEGPALLAHVHDALVQASAGAVQLLPSFPTRWLGQGVEVHGAPTVAGTVSFAVRWHGERPAVLWEVIAAPGTAGGAIEPPALSCPGLDPAWQASGWTGEALLAKTVLPGPSADDGETPSFS